MNKTIMVVDDEPDILETVTLILQKQGYNVVTATNGKECLKTLSKEKPQLILLDIMMPGMPSRELVKKIKGPKIVYLSAVRMSDAEKEDLLKTDKIVDFIQKPFELRDLLKRVEKHITS